MKLSVHFYKPLAIGAPQPLRELPVRPERMIHFFPPHIDKIREKYPKRQSRLTCCANWRRDSRRREEAARTSFIEIARATDFGANTTALWTRVNALNSPWFLDDMTEYCQGRRQQLM